MLPAIYQVECHTVLFSIQDNDYYPGFWSRFILVFLFVLPPGISSLDFKRSSGFRDTAEKKSGFAFFHSAVKTLLFNIFGCGFQHYSDPYSYAWKRSYKGAGGVRVQLNDNEAKSKELISSRSDILVPLQKICPIWEE